MKTEKKYEAYIITTGGTFVWRSNRIYGSHAKAIAAIIRKAKKMKMRTAGYVRGWKDGVSDVVDFGSYSYYGKVRRFA